jgi:ABC-type nitrate/sulfonate/bicarbonate transport system substrate-binding protein
MRIAFPPNRGPRLSGLVAIVMALLVAACGPGAEETAEPAPAPTPEVEGDAEPTDPEPDDGEETPAPTRMQDVLLAIPAPSLNFLPYMMAVEQGLDVYEREGINLTVDIIRGDVALAGLLEGSIDFTAAGGTAMRAALGGAPVKAVMFTVGQTTFSIVAAEGIDSVDDLRGQTVGLVGAGLSDTTGVALQAALRSADIDAERDLDVFVAPTPPDILSALLGGSIQAAVLAPPQSIVAQGAGFTEIAQLWDYIDLTQGQIAASTEMLEGDPDLVRAFIRGSLAAIEYVLDNEEAAVDFITSRFDLERDVAERSYEVMRDAYARDGRASDDGILGELGPDATPDDIERAVDRSPLDEVLAGR